MRAKSNKKSKVRFGETPLQRTPATAGTLSDGQAFKPTRETRVLLNCMPAQ